MPGRFFLIACLCLAGCSNPPPLVELIQDRLKDRLSRDGWRLDGWQRESPNMITVRVEIPDSEALAALDSIYMEDSVMAKANRLCPTRAIFGGFDGNINDWSGLGDFSVDIVASDGARVGSYVCRLSES